MKLGILKAFSDQHKYYIRACEDLNVEYEIIDIINHNWLELIRKSTCDGFVCRPPSKFQERKSMFDERLYIIDKFLKIPIYPSYDELFIYENKKMMDYWLAINNIKHAKTYVFYDKHDYQEFVQNAQFPLVFKTNIGSTAKGVEIIKNKATALRIGKKIFGSHNSKLVKGYTPQKTGKVFKFQAVGGAQKHFVILQEFIDVVWEWRMVKIGESYFGHKKLLKNDFASGSKLKGWDRPSDELLYLTKDICEKGKFLSMDIDIFETPAGEFYVNELQAIFGQSTEHLMKIDESPGRFVFANNKFNFEEGEFNQNQSFNLRVKHFMNILKESNNAK